MLFGRDVECARIDAVLDAARERRSQALVLRGEAGIGKSALLQYAVQRAEDFLVLNALGVESAGLPRVRVGISGRIRRSARAPRRQPVRACPHRTLLRGLTAEIWSATRCAPAAARCSRNVRAARITAVGGTSPRRIARQRRAPSSPRSDCGRAAHASGAPDQASRRGGPDHRDVAARLFLSPKTVEFHLTRIYRKLDIHSRDGLVRRRVADGGEKIEVRAPR